MPKLDKITLRGFKSIETLEDFRLDSLNVLIGANGAGKSNFVDFFRMLRAMVEQRFQLYVSKNGPADGYFYNGVAFTRRIEADLVFGDVRYGFVLEPTADGKIVFASEMVEHLPSGSTLASKPGLLEPSFPGLTGDRTLPVFDRNVFKSFSLTGPQVYHFHDTSMTAGMRRDVGVERSETLEPDAANLAAVLLNLRRAHPENYDLLGKTLRRVAPYFDKFELRATSAAPQDTVRLTWRRKGSDYVFSPGHFSDGTIRFLCLATVLFQPNPPATIVLDEPELGLHPEALAVFAGLIRSASARTQIVLTTQSPPLLSEFEPEQIVTVDQVNGATQFNRLDAVALNAWLADFTLGELWQKGTIRGGVNHA